MVNITHGSEDRGSLPYERCYADHPSWDDAEHMAEHAYRRGAQQGACLMAEALIYKGWTKADASELVMAIGKLRNGKMNRKQDVLERAVHQVVSNPSPIRVTKFGFWGGYLPDMRECTG